MANETQDNMSNSQALEEAQATLHESISNGLSRIFELIEQRKITKLEQANLLFDMLTSTIDHLKDHGDIRPLCRVVAYGKLNAVSKRVIRQTIPGLKAVKGVKNPDGSVDTNKFKVVYADGFLSPSENGFINNEKFSALMAEKESWLARPATTRAALDPFHKDSTALSTIFPDNAPKKSMDKNKTALSKALANRLKDFRKRGQDMTQEEMMECVREAFNIAGTASQVVETQETEQA